MPGFLATTIPFFSALYVGHYLAPSSDPSGPTVDKIQGISIVHFGANLFCATDNTSFVLTYGFPSTQPRTSSYEDFRDFLKSSSNASDWALVAFNSLKNELILATDQYGTRPIFWADASAFENPPSPNPFAFSSHPSPLHRLGIGPDVINQVPPNTVLTFAVKPLLIPNHGVSLQNFRDVAPLESLSDFSAAALVDQITNLLSGSIQQALGKLHSQTSSVLLWTSRDKGGSECDPLFRLTKKVLDTLPVLLKVEETHIAANDIHDKAGNLALNNVSMTEYPVVAEHLGSMCEP